jgi:hypothetical protein
VSFVLDLLGDDFSQDELLGEIFGPDHNSVFTRWSARHECCQH